MLGARRIGVVFGRSCLTRCLSEASGAIPARMSSRTLAACSASYKKKEHIFSFTSKFVCIKYQYHICGEVVEYTDKSSSIERCQVRNQ